MIRALSILLLFCVSVMAQLPPGVMQNLQSIKRWPAVTSGLVEYYPMNGSSIEQIGLSVATAGSTNVGFEYGGKFSEYSFNAPGILTPEDKYVTVSSNQWLGTTNCSVSFWYRTKLRRVDIVMASYTSGNQGFYISALSADGSLSMALQVPGFASSCLIPAGTFAENIWYYVTFTRSLGVIIGYVNGILKGASGTVNFTAPFSQEVPISFGGFSYLLGGYPNLRGNLQDIAIYNRALSSNEVFQLYKGFTAPP